MNIDDYRAMIAQEKEDATHKSEQTQTPNETKPIEKPKEEPTQENKIETLPDKLTIDGVGEITLDELKKGYLRTSDYTRKTQEVNKQRKEAEEAIKFYENLKSNPELAQEIASKTQIPRDLDPTQAKVVELENKLYDMMLQNEINNLQHKYPDFEVREVLPIAHEKGLLNLEDAYLLSKSQKTPTSKSQENINVDDLKKQLREEIIKELDNEKNSTRTIISTNSTDVHLDDKPKMSEAERKVAKGMHLTDEEYIKWRDKK